MRKITINLKKKATNDRIGSVLLIDASYFCYYRFTATSSWFAKMKRIGPITDCHLDNQVFKDYYSNQFNNTITKLKTKFKTDRIYWFGDCPQDQIWRHQHYDGYKGHRGGENPTIEQVFGYSFDHLIPNNLLIKVPSAEGDDCLAVCAQMYQQKYPANTINIVSGDSDFLQLVNHNVKLISLRNKMEETPIQIKIGTGKSKRLIEMDGPTYLKTKILMGDKTDGITPVFDGCGPVKAYQLASNQQEFDQEIIDDKLERFKLNQLMISFDHIDPNIRSLIEEQFHKHLI